MNILRWMRRGLTIAVLALAAACGDAATGVKAGNVTVSLVTPNADDGAVLVAVFGPAPAAIQAASAAYRVYSFTASPNEVRVLVAGDLSAGALLTLSVDDPGRIAEYHGTVVEVASRTDEIRPSLLEYELTFAAR